MNAIIPSINYHLTKSCNMKCKFCFATFNDLGVVKHNLENSKKIISEIAKNGFTKITFAGGEPTLIKELPEIVKYAKELGLITTIVTNGAKLSEELLLRKLAPYLDWVALSIDTLNDELNIKSGRAINGGNTAITEPFFVELIEKLKQLNIRVKINTVVSNYNWKEDMNAFISSVKPDRWKVLQALKVDGQNDLFQDNFEITDTQFKKYLIRNRSALLSINNAIEKVELIKGSYLMISPEGTLYDNTGKAYTYSEPIIKIGLSQALKQINFDKSKFIERGGYYNYENKNKMREKVA
ncbi:viperin family antiviral radical SAM protein [Lutibacter sp.]|uniref:viperin family antiviral radical SAM protein n=1 Tax=Lutibacter sp. TaxID=1925666 RepID=UPI003569C229